MFPALMLASALATIPVSAQVVDRTLPTAAIQRNAQGAFVYVLKPDQTAAMQTISVGTTDGNIAAVEGLNAGDVVAVDGFDKLQNGVKVVARSTPEAADGGGAQ